MKFHSKKLKELFEASDSKSFVLPHFQRNFVWDQSKQKTLLSTFIVNLPTGNFLTLLGDNKDFPARNVCLTTEVSPAIKCSYLLDGQQRFSVFKNTFSNFYDEDKPENWKTIWELLYPKLRSRYFLNVDADDADYFGFKKLIFDRKKFDLLEPSLIENLIIEKKILVKNSDAYYHPGFIPKDKKKKAVSKSVRRGMIAKAMADEILVPLYEIYGSGPQSLHDTVLNKIAFNRMEELKAELDGDNTEIANILSSVDENIEVYLKKKQKAEIDVTWVRLQTKWANDLSAFLTGLMANEMLEIELEKDETSRAFAIFEIINLPGTPLSEYDLIVAKAAKNSREKQLSERILDYLRTSYSLPTGLTCHIHKPIPKESFPFEVGSINKDGELSNEFKVRFLQMLSVLTYCLRKDNPEDISIAHLKRGKFLTLKGEDINTNYLKAITCVSRALDFLRFRCGIKSIEEIPYKLMLLPIAYVLLNEKVWGNKESLNRIEYWYWVSLFGGSYSSDQNDRAFKDMISLSEFLTLKPKDLLFHDFYIKRYKAVLNEHEYSTKSILMCQEKEDIPVSVHKAILQYILSNQPMDFLIDKDGESQRLNSWDFKELEDHHICPLYGMKSLNESTSVLRNDKKIILNSPLNRTLISKDANRKIGSYSPDEYFKYVEESSKFHHFIKSPFEKVYTKGATENKEKYYERVCEERYEELLGGLKKELLSLIGK
jgi:hypothetical protein